MSVGRILALDVGERRIGVAVSDPLGITAQGVETIFSKGEKRDIQRIEELSAQYQTRRLVVGLPKSMDGSIGQQAARVMAFARTLEAQGFEIHYQDERLTTAQARRTLLEADVSRKKRKESIDMLAAVCILQSYMDAQASVHKSKNVEEPDKMEGEMKNDNEIVELIDENDQTVRFEHLMTLEYEGDAYVLLVPVDEVEDVGEDEVVILRIEEDEDGDDAYVGVEDEALLEKIFEEYLRIAEADEDEE